MAIISSLPKRKPNSPNAQIVCWKCKRGDITLYRVTPKEKGKHRQYKFVRNMDYVCEDDRAYGEPEIANCSKIYYKYA